MTTNIDKKANRQALANYLLSGRPLVKFDMSYYSQAGDNWLEVEEEDCGSVGCVIGHSTLIGFNKAKNEDWYSYTFRLFCDNDYQFHWMFGSGWSRVDNTMEGAAKRIIYFHEFGLPPATNPVYYWSNPDEYEKLIARVDALASEPTKF